MLLFAIFAITWMVLIGSLISSLTNSVATASATPTVIATESPVAEQPVNAPVEPVIAEPAEPAPLPTESATPIEPVPWKPTLLNHQENFDGFRLKEVSSCDTLFFVFPDHSVWVGKKTRLTQGVEITGTPVLIGENRCAGPRGGWVWTTTLPMANQGVSWFKISLNDQGVSTLWWTGSVYGKEVVTRNSMTYAGDLDQPYRDIARWIEENAQYLSFPLRRDWGQAVTSHFNQ
jgi:hypothetical protein